jgi:hypothetical protein
MQRPVVDPTRPAPPAPVIPQPPAATDSVTPDSASHERGA